MSHCLLVFHNAEVPSTLAPFLPGGPGHFLITARNPHWYAYAAPGDVREGELHGPGVICDGHSGFASLCG
jgi:hypothetical protein